MKSEVVNKDYYRVLLRDFIIVNLAVAFGAVSMWLYLFLQAMDVIPTFPCTFKQMTGLYCPGCGGTRAFTALVRHHFVKSFKYNPSLICGGLFALYYEATVILTLIKKNGKKYFPQSAVPVYVFLIIMGIYYVARDVALAVWGIDWIANVK